MAAWVMVEETGVCVEAARVRVEVAALRVGLAQKLGFGLRKLYLSVHEAQRCRISFSPTTIEMANYAMQEC